MADPRNRLWRQYLRFVQAARPEVFVIENVDRFRSSSEFALLKQEEQGGLLADYTLTDGVLHAADYGVPQRRRRLGAWVSNTRFGVLGLVG